MSLGTVAPAPWFTGLKDDGTPNAGGFLYTYVAGTTSTPLDTWSDIELIDANLNSNPIVLDAAGRATIFCQESTYKYVMQDSDGYLIRTQDNVPSTQVGQSGGLGEIFQFGGDVSAPVTATSYPSGATVDKLAVGTSLYKVDSVNLVGTYKFQAMIRGDGTVTVTVAVVDLDDGSPDTPLATATSTGVTSATGQLVTSGEITFAAAGTEKNYGIKVKIDVAGAGYVWGVKLVRTE